MVRIIIKEVNGDLQETQIDGTSLPALQAVVGGYLEQVCVDATRRLALYCNEHGKIEGIPFNFRIPGDIVCGTVIFFKHDRDGELEDLSDNDVEFLTHWLAALPEFPDF